VSNPRPLTLDEPLDIDEARKAARVLARQRRDAEEVHEAQVEKAAAAERAYRQAYAKAFVAATGTAGEREAKAKAESSQEAYERDLAAGMVKAFAERLRGLEGERSMLKSICEWSMRLDPFAVELRERPRSAA
jgi:hypothetical protein